MSVNDGGQAFPRAGFDGPEGAGEPIAGMSLRDWFAGQALAGWLASFGPGEAVKAESVAEFSYEIADAMLAARNGGAQ